jgi:hypothetical protein
LEKANAIDMAKSMSIAGLDLVAESTPNAQPVAVLDDPYRISMKWARIPEPAA